MFQALRGLGALLVLSCLCACSTAPHVLVKPVLRQTDWVSYDGKVMPYTSWQVPPEMETHGVVIAVHGLSGAASDFWYLGEKLPKSGFTVYAYELRGQGNDPVEANRGDIESARQWMRDLATFHQLVRRRHPHVPIYWYGESLGSLICLHTAGKYFIDPRGPDGLVLASPVAGLRMTVSSFRRWMLEAAARLAPRSRYSLGELAGVDESKIQVTTTTTHGSQMQITKHHVSSFTLRLLSEVGRLIDENPDVIRRVRVPMLFLASPNDVLSSADQVQWLFSQVKSSKKKLNWYTKSYHLLLHDVQREDVSNDLINWLNTRVASEVDH